MRLSEATVRGVLVCAVLVACTPHQGETPPATRPTTLEVPTVSAAPPSPTPTAGPPDRSEAPSDGPPDRSEAPSDGPTGRAEVLVWADGTIVDGPSLDLGEARRVRLGSDVEHVRDVPAEPGKLVYLYDLRPDGSFLTVAGDAGLTGGGGGSVGALREVTEGRSRTLTSPHDEHADMRESISQARRVDGGVAWVEPYFELAGQRLVLAPAGSSRGRLVHQLWAVDGRIAALARWGAVLADGRVVGWDGKVSGEPADLDLEVSHRVAGDDVVETRCSPQGCEIALLTEGGKRQPLLRGPSGTWVDDSDGRFLLVHVDGGDGVSELWGVDIVDRTAVRIVGELYAQSMSDGRIVDQDHPATRAVVVDLVARTVEQLAVDGSASVAGIAGGLVALTSHDGEGAGTDGDGGDILRWPRR
ncbi:hypothetical protein IGS67_03750 [Flavimobilis sp. GY10621]|uniref:Uncharacterized protein n=1 Tax=Flavimobilis rhizosphaerae TaxID=2775421 RepID=A0ABR9DNV3_9MICO|nr:hypothetical protein [Flavimobilis rhizosphaerae]MBD9698609.1 hypothetical protein [Flavimobilis rhizosphaerae]